MSDLLWSDHDIGRWVKANELSWDSRFEAAYSGMKRIRRDYEAKIAELEAKLAEARKWLPDSALESDDD